MILNKSQLVTNINNELTDSANRQISPEDIRHNLVDIIDSAHNLLIDRNISSLNIATHSDSRDSSFGINTLSNISLPGGNSADNTAIGFNALKSNYQGLKNVAVGSYALSCNAYGSGNIAVGYQALAGNTVGHTNIGIGMYTLHNNKGGQNNVAIGRGAGYYVGKTTSNKLFIANHPVSEDYICNNPDGTGLSPLIYGDFGTGQVGINTPSLHSNAVLQVGGNFTPSITNKYSIGSADYRWRYALLQSGIYFDDLYFGKSPYIDGFSVLGDLVPSNDDRYSLGSSARIWQSGFFNDIQVTGTAYINELVSITQDYSTNKNLYVGINQDGDGYLNDENLSGGGYGLKSTSDTYEITFYPSTDGLSCFDGVKNKSTWRSNISLEVPSGGYFRANSIVSYEVGNQNCYGLYFNSGISYISRKNVLQVNPGSEQGHLAGVGNVNIVSNSGELEDYVFSLLSVESGVSVSQRFITGSKHRSIDPSNDKDKLKGFEIKYIDDSNSEVQGALSDRLVIGSYNYTSDFVNGLTFMKDSPDGSVLCVTNISDITEDILPETIFNIRSDSEAVVRVTSETDEETKAAIQLLGIENCETSGIEIAYHSNSGVADFTMYDNSEDSLFIRFNAPSGSIGILSSGVTTEAITIGHSGISGLPVIALKDSTYIDDLQEEFLPTSGYGKIYNLYNDKTYANQYNDLKFLDPSGNSFDIIVNKLDNVDARAVYTDPSGNTFAGYLAPSGRKEITEAVSGNTVYGYQGLYNILSGSGNIAIGYNSASGIQRGNDNIVIGSNSFNTMSSGNNNIVIGNKSFIRDNDGSTSGNIIIGNNLGNNSTGSYRFLLGSKENVILMDGSLGPKNADKYLTFPSGGTIYINSYNDSESLKLANDNIQVIDYGGSDYPENSLNFTFTGNESSTLLTLNHEHAPLTNKTFYASQNRPYAELNGDLKLKGTISFSDGTSLYSSAFLRTISALTLQVNSLFVEGYVAETIENPQNAKNPTTGELIAKNASWNDVGSYTLVNRDVTSRIPQGAYVIAININDEYRPIWISAIDVLGSCCD